MKSWLDECSLSTPLREAKLLCTELHRATAATCGVTDNSDNGLKQIAERGGEERRGEERRKRGRRERHAQAAASALS
jgi:hypothetical protein